MSNELFSRRNIAELALEGAVVVISILIAFALDAWWNDRQLQQETAEDLAIVQFELSENIRLIRVTTDIIDQVLAANNVRASYCRLRHDSGAQLECTSILVACEIFVVRSIDV